MFILFTIESPYIKELRESWKRNRSRILDTAEQLNFILEETRTDVYNQFTEKQGEWKALATYTVKKKAKANSDTRILHESKGKARLKDAYYATGTVDGNQLIYHYPTSKPYAEEHQEGAIIDSPTKAKEKRKGGRYKGQKREEALDTEFLRRAGLPSFFNDLFN